MSDVTRFQSPRPKYQAPTNATALEATTPKPKDTTPAPSVVERTAADGNESLAKLLADSQAAAKQAAKVVEGEKKPRAPRKASSTDAPTSQTATSKVDVPKFKPEDVVDDATFIRRTRDNIMSPEVQALFWANGGDKYLQGGLSYAQALDNMRRAIMQRMRNPQAPTASYSRHTSLPVGKVVTPGMPTQQDQTRRMRAQETARRVVINERWAGIRK